MSASRDRWPPVGPLQASFSSIRTRCRLGYTRYRMSERRMREVHDATSCSVAATSELIGSKWTALIVHDLSEGPRRLTELEHACPGISPRPLAAPLHLVAESGVSL